MFKLARLFSKSKDPSGADHPEQEAELEAYLAKTLATIRREWPRLAVDDASFIGHLRRCVPEGADPVTALSSLHLKDLFLARACLDGLPGAAETFDRLYRPVVARYLARIKAAPDLVEDVTQLVFSHALVGPTKSTSALAGYQGRSTLAHFIGIAAQRRALDDRRAQRGRQQLVDRLARQPVPSPRNAEQNLLRQEYRKPFEAALQQAVAGLSARERVVMRLHLVGGVSTTQIAKMYNVNQATISRWLSRARSSIWAGIQDRLRKDLGLSSGDFESLMGNVGSNVELGLSLALRSEDGSERDSTTKDAASPVSARSHGGGGNHSKVVSKSKFGMGRVGSR